MNRLHREGSAATGANPANWFVRLICDEQRFAENYGKFLA